MKKFLSILICLCFIVSAASATLLNTTDQVLNRNIGLGGNPAVRAYNKVSNAEGGMSLLVDKVAQNDLVLNQYATAGYDGADKDPVNSKDLFLQYTHKLDADQWLSGKYSNNSFAVKSLSAKYRNDGAQYDGTAKFTAEDVAGREVTALTYAKDMNKAVKGLFLGLEYASNRDYLVQDLSLNSDAKAEQGTLHKAESIVTQTKPYTSVALGGIYQLDNASKMTFAHKFFTSQFYSITGRDVNHNKTDTYYNEEKGNETTIGYIRKITNELELGGTMTSVPDVSYIMDRTTVGGVKEQDITMKKFGHTAFSVAAEYALMKDVALQGTIGWANKVGQINIPGEGDYTRPTDTTDLSINAIKTMDAHTILVGVQQKKTVTDYADTPAGGVGTVDETKVYANYAYAF